MAVAIVVAANIEYDKAIIVVVEVPMFEYAAPETIVQRSKQA